MTTKRLRIFAGPNGSGKSSLYAFLVRRGYFSKRISIDADVIAQRLGTNGFGLQRWPVSCDWEGFLASARRSSRPTHGLRLEELERGLVLKGRVFRWRGRRSATALNVVAALLADYLVERMLEQDGTFSCETVFSHQSKLELISRAKVRGFRVYLYFVSTRDPEINCERVKTRVAQGGHPVPRNKVIARYRKTLENARAAMSLADRVYFFDNSESVKGSFLNFATFDNGKITFSDADNVPAWFVEYVLPNSHGKQT